MKRKHEINIIYLYILLFVLLAAVVYISINSGSISLGPGEILEIIFSGESISAAGKIIWHIRLPRLCAALFLGGALALSGYLLQVFFTNPIAGPYVLGISSGAKLCVAFLMVGIISNGLVMKSWMLVSTAFAGSMAATFIVLLVAGRVRSMSVLIVCGVMTGYICSAVTELVVSLADDSNIVNLHNWSMGSFSAASWSDAAWYIPITGLGLLASLFLAKPMLAYLFGEEYAMSLGINIRLFRLLLIVTSSLLSATVTAFAGPVSFVGIAVAHVIRCLFKSSRPIILIPAVFLGGAIFCVLSDLLARTMFAPNELSISTITAIFGAPVVIWMLLKKNAGHKH